MIDLYYWPTPNGHKITIFLEETGLPYKIVPVNIGKGEQFQPDFLTISPNNRMPGDRRSRAGRRRRADLGVRVRRDPGLSRREDRQVPADRAARPRRGDAVAVLADGRARADGRPEPPFPQLRAREDALRDRALRATRPTGSTACWTSGSPTATFLAGDYSIADMACYPWIVPYERQGQKLADFPHLKRWFEAIEARPAVQAGLREGEGNQPEPRWYPYRGGARDSDLARPLPW